MAAGTLDRRIVLRVNQAPETSTSASGQPVPDWVDLDTVWAWAEPLQGRERFIADQVAAHVDTRFVIRYRSDVTPENRIVHEGRTFNITRATELLFWKGVQLGRRQYLEILAEARAEAV